MHAAYQSKLTLFMSISMYNLNGFRDFWHVLGIFTCRWIYLWKYPSIMLTISVHPIRMKKYMILPCFGVISVVVSSRYVPPRQKLRAWKILQIQPNKCVLQCKIMTLLGKSVKQLWDSRLYYMTYTWVSTCQKNFICNEGWLNDWHDPEY